MLRDNPKLEIVFVSQSDIPQGFELVVIDRLRAEASGMVDLAGRGVI